MVIIQESLDSQKQASHCEEICLKWEILQVLLWSLLSFCNCYRSGFNPGNQKQLSLNKRNLTWRMCYIADGKELNYPTWWMVNSDGSSEISNCNMALSGQEERHKVRHCCKGRKGQAWAGSTMGVSAEAETAAGKEWSGTGWNHEGGTAIAEAVLESTANRKNAWSCFLSPTSQSNTMLPIGQERPRLPGKQNKSLRTVVPWNAELTLESSRKR